MNIYVVKTSFIYENLHMDKNRKTIPLSLILLQILAILNAFFALIVSYFYLVRFMPVLHKTAQKNTKKSIIFTQDQKRYIESIVSLISGSFSLIIIIWLANCGFFCYIIFFLIFFLEGIF